MDEMIYTNSEKLIKTYFGFDKDTNGESTVTTARLLGSMGDKSVFFITMIERNAQEQDMFFYSVLSVPNDQVESSFYSAQEILHDGKIWTFESEQQKFNVLCHDGAKIGFFASKKSKDIVYAINVEQKFDKYQNSPDKTFDGKNDAMAKEILLKHIDYVGNFKNQKLHEIMMALYKKINVENPEQQAHDQEIIETLQYAIYVLENGTQDQMQEIVDIYFDAICEVPMVMEQIKKVCKENFGKNYTFNAQNMSEMRALPLSTKATLLKTYLTDGIDKGIFTSEIRIHAEGTNSSQVQDVLDETTLALYDGLVLIQREMGIISEFDNDVLFDTEQEFETTPKDTRYMN